MRSVLAYDMSSEPLVVRIVNAQLATDGGPTVALMSPRDIAGAATGHPFAEVEVRSDSLLVRNEDDEAPYAGSFGSTVYVRLSSSEETLLVETSADGLSYGPARAIDVAVPFDAVAVRFGLNHPASNSVAAMFEIASP